MNPEGSTTDLGPAFRLPEYIEADPELVALYREWIRKLSSESKGIPMHTVQEFLLERIATKYVIMKFRERNNTWVGVNTEKDFAAHWLDLVKEWNKVLSAGHDQLRNEVLRQAEAISLEGLKLIEDEETRKAVLRFYKEQYAKLGF